MNGTGPIRLTLMVGRQIALPVPAEVAAALLSAQVTVAAGQRSGFQLAFDLSKNGLINRTLLPAGFFDPPARVILTVTVKGVPSVLMVGAFLRHEVCVSGDTGKSKLTLSGEDLKVLMDLEMR